MHHACTHALICKSMNLLTACLGGLLTEINPVRSFSSTESSAVCWFLRIGSTTLDPNPCIFPLWNFWAVERFAICVVIVAIRRSGKSIVEMRHFSSSVKMGSLTCRPPFGPIPVLLTYAYLVCLIGSVGLLAQCWVDFGSDFGTDFGLCAVWLVRCLTPR